MKRSSMLSNNNQFIKKSREIDPSEVKTKPCHDKIFLGCNFYLLKAGTLTSTRSKIFEKNILNFQGTISKELNDSVTYIVVDDTFDWPKIKLILNDFNLNKILRNCYIVKAGWLSQCIKSKTNLEIDQYKILPAQNDITKVNTKPIEINTPKNVTGEKIISTEYACAKSSGVKHDFNMHIIQKLEGLMETYRNTKDQWRTFSYRKAINILERLPKPIESYEEAKALLGIGESLANKIWEIIESGKLRKLDEISMDEKIQAINMFNQVWGVGPTTAEGWVQQGYRTLEDLRDKAKLTKNQTIGLKHYHDFLERMPREEAGKIIETVKYYNKKHSFWEILVKLR